MLRNERDILQQEVNKLERELQIHQQAVAQLEEYYGEDLISVTVELLNYEDVPITYDEIIDIFEEEELISAQEFNSYPIN